MSDAAAATSRHLGLDLGGTNIKWVVVERAQRPDASDEWIVVDRDQVPTLADGGPAAVIERLAQAGRAAVARCGMVATAGVGVPGLYDPRSGATLMLPNLPGEWRGVPVGPYVGRGMGQVATYLINDARAFGLAELSLGAGRGAACMIGLTLGTGVGGVVCLDGRVVLGHDGTAGEFGHQIVEVDGRPCTCGARGCLEAYARADRIEELCGTATAAEAVERAKSGDARAQRGLDEVCRYLGIGIASAIAVLTPDRVVIGGGIAAAGETILEPIRQSVREHVFTTDVDRVEIVTAQLGTWSGAIGAAVHGAHMAGSA